MLSMGCTYCYRDWNVVLPRPLHSATFFKYPNSHKFGENMEPGQYLFSWTHKVRNDLECKLCMTQICLEDKIRIVFLLWEGLRTITMRLRSGQALRQRPRGANFVIEWHTLHSKIMLIYSPLSIVEHKSPW